MAGEPLQLPVPLSQARVLIAGAGGLGSPAAMALAAAGVGRLTLADDDYVELSNLQRQILHGSKRLGLGKVESARATLAAIAPNLALELWPARVAPENAVKLCARHHVVIDATDGMANKYLLNDACYFAERPLIHAGVLGWSGQLAVFWRGHGPCLRCLSPEPAAHREVPCSAQVGIFGAVPGVAGFLEAQAALDLLTTGTSPLLGAMIFYDPARGEMRSMAVARDEDCPLCGRRPTVKDLSNPDTYSQPCACRSPGGRCLGLTGEENERFQRHLALPEMGAAGQEKLLRSRVIICGLAAEAQMAALYAAAVGFGTIALLPGEGATFPERLFVPVQARTAEGLIKAVADRCADINPGVSLATFAAGVSTSDVLTAWGKADQGAGLGKSPGATVILDFTAAPGRRAPVFSLLENGFAEAAVETGWSAEGPWWILLDGQAPAPARPEPLLPGSPAAPLPLAGFLAAQSVVAAARRVLGLRSFAANQIERLAMWRILPYTV